MTVTVYTDASHCQRTDIAVCGFAIVVNDVLVRHQVVIISECKTSGDAEFYAATLGLQEAFMQKDVLNINLMVDFIAICFFKNAYKAKKKPRAHEYSETIKMIVEEGIGLSVNHVKAHNKNVYNNKVDLSCRNTLRKYNNKIK